MSLTCPIWQCISTEALVKLIMFQWECYGTVLEFMLKADYSEIESLEEITHLIRIPSKWGRPKRG